jgi:mono/diheme cytochrome c family protein
LIEVNAAAAIRVGNMGTETLGGVDMGNERMAETFTASGKGVLAIGLLVGAAGTAEAQSIEFGQMLFQQNCAACHGTEGAGDGPVAVYIEPKPADLRKLAESNDGAYPFGRVWDSISKGSLSAHGTSMMPVWGDLFMAEALPKEVHPGVSAQAIVEARMMALTYYIQSIQE